MADQVSGGANAPERVLFIGLGAMGSQMVGHLPAADRSVTAHDADPARVATAVAEAGVTASADLGDEAEAADAVVLSLPDSKVVEAVLLDGGLLARMRPGTVVLDMTSAQPASTVELARQAAERGVGFVDAPVSGGVSKAKSGMLSIMVGGSDEDVAKVQHLIDLMGGAIVRTGPAGSGHAMKALNNLLSAIGLVGACEVIAAGAKFGLDPHLMVRILNNSSGRNFSTDVKIEQFVLSDNPTSGFSVGLMVKDLGMAVQIGADVDAPLTLGERALAAAQATLEEVGDPLACHTLVGGWVGRQAGVDLAAAAPEEVAS